MFYPFEIYILVWGLGSITASATTVLELVYAHANNSIATKQSKSSLSHPSSSLFFMDDEYEFCQKDIAKGWELLSKMGGVSSQEETKEAT